MARANRRLPAQADEIVFVVIGKSKHLMGYDVADIQDQVPVAIEE